MQIKDLSPKWVLNYFSKISKVYVKKIGNNNLYKDKFYYENKVGDIIKVKCKVKKAMSH